MRQSHWKQDSENSLWTSWKNQGHKPTHNELVPSQKLIQNIRPGTQYCQPKKGEENNIKKYKYVLLVKATFQPSPSPGGNTGKKVGVVSSIQWHITDIASSPKQDFYRKPI